MVSARRSAQLRVCNVITGLSVGGAETMLSSLVHATAGLGVANSIVSLTSDGPIGERLAADGFLVTALDGRRGIPDPRLVLKLSRLLRADSPDLVHTWMYHANVVGSLAARLAGIRPVLWNIRAARLERGREKGGTIALAKFGGVAARVLSSRIVVNSSEGMAVHERLGYPVTMLEQIPNGFDLSVLTRDTEGGARIRRDHGIPANAPVIGIVGRYHPAKDHATFFAAASRIAAARPDAHYVLAGEGLDRHSASLTALLPADLAGRVHLLGRRGDLPAVYSSLNVLALSSIYEGFPNVVAEAMACEVPVVSTDVGDAAEIIGNTGRIVQPRDADALAAACIALLALPGSELRSLGAKARSRVSERYSLSAIARRYVALYERITT